MCSVTPSSAPERFGYNPLHYLAFPQSGLLPVAPLAGRLHHVLVKLTYLVGCNNCWKGFQWPQYSVMSIPSALPSSCFPCFRLPYHQFAAVYGFCNLQRGSKSCYVGPLERINRRLLNLVAQTTSKRVTMIYRSNSSIASSRP